MEQPAVIPTDQLLAGDPPLMSLFAGDGSHLTMMSAVKEYLGELSTGNMRCVPSRAMTAGGHMTELSGRRRKRPAT